MSSWLPNEHAPWQRHALTSLIIWSLVLMCQVSAYLVMVYADNAALTALLGIILFVRIYGAIYRSMLIRDRKVANRTGSSGDRHARA